MSYFSHKFDKTIVRSYDIRGIYGKTLFDLDAFVIGHLFGLRVGKKKIINVGFDGRKSSQDLKENLINGILDSGAYACEIGLVPTPLLYFSCISNNSSGGIMVTGSHNPKNYNGFKFVLDNLPFYGEDLKEIEKKAKKYFIPSLNGKRTKIDIESKYLADIFRNFSQKKKINIVWDSGNGAGGNVMKKISRKINGNQKLLFSEIDGNFPNHHPDPSDPKNLLFCVKEIKKNGFDIGIAFDGDGDRIGVVDDKGRIVNGDILLLILAKHIIKKLKKSIIIADVKCSQVLFDEVDRLGARSVMSKTGHSHVKINMKKYKAELAGEMSGHIFFRENHGFDDAFFASIELIKILTSSNKKLSEIIDEIPKVCNTPEIRIECDDKNKFKLIDKIRKKLKKSKKKIIDIDGLRVSDENGWWLIRASNTQPGVVIRCEAKDNECLRNLLLDLKSLIKDFNPEVSEKIIVEN